jgi:hypothetical protein
MGIGASVGKGGNGHCNEDREEVREGGGRGGDGRIPSKENW